MISVIVPYWNSEPWIGRCCESLRVQSGEMEFLLINDRSTDNGPEIVRKYAETDPRFRALENERGKGVSGARNTGLDHAKGEYITFLDADDEMLDNSFHTFKQVIAEDPGVNTYQLNHLRFRAETGATMMKYRSENKRYRVPDLPMGWWGVWNKLFTAEIVKTVRFDETLQYGEDGLFVLEVLALDPVMRHAKTGLCTVRHRIENIESLSHLKTSEGFLKHIHSYEDFLFRQTDPLMRQMMCQHISELWADTRAMKLFGWKEN